MTWTKHTLRVFFDTQRTENYFPVLCVLPKPIAASKTFRHTHAQNSKNCKKLHPKSIYPRYTSRLHPSKDPQPTAPDDLTLSKNPLGGFEEESKNGHHFFRKDKNNCCVSRALADDQLRSRILARLVSISRGAGAREILPTPDDGGNGPAAVCVRSFPAPKSWRYAIDRADRWGRTGPPGRYKA